MIEDEGDPQRGDEGRQLRAAPKRTESELLHTQTEQCSKQDRAQQDRGQDQNAARGGPIQIEPDDVDHGCHQRSGQGEDIAVCEVERADGAVDDRHADGIQREDRAIDESEDEELQEKIAAIDVLPAPGNDHRSRGSRLSRRRRFSGGPIRLDGCGTVDAAFPFCEDMSRSCGAG